MHLLTAPSVAYWVIYAREEVGLDQRDDRRHRVLGLRGGRVRQLPRRLADRPHRAEAHLRALLRARRARAREPVPHPRAWSAQYVLHITCVGSFGAAIAATHVYASELFPTEIRATGYGWATNLFGRVTEILTPALIGLLIPRSASPGRCRWWASVRSSARSSCCATRPRRAGSRSSRSSRGLRPSRHVSPARSAGSIRASAPRRPRVWPSSTR